MPYPPKPDERFYEPGQRARLKPRELIEEIASPLDIPLIAPYGESVLICGAIILNPYGDWPSVAYRIQEDGHKNLYDSRWFLDIDEEIPKVVHVPLNDEF